MKYFFKKLLSVVTHVQLLAVFLAFALMVFLSYHFMSGIERRHLIANVNNAIANTQSYIEADLMEPKATLGIVSENIRMMILNGAGFDEVKRYIDDITAYIITDENYVSYATSVFGCFDIFDGKFLTGIGWAPPDDYLPHTRPWYDAAVRADGKVGETDPYLNIGINKTTISFSRCIFDDQGQRLGIVGLDILLDRIAEYAVNTFATDDSYGILLDKNFYVLAHPHPAYAGKHLRQMNDGLAIERDLKDGIQISERKATDYNGNESVLFIRELNNGWYLAIIAYAKKYYQSVTNIAYILVALGIIFAAGLSAILLSIIMSRKRAEERTKIMLDATPLCANFWDRNYVNIDCNSEALKLFGISGKNEYLERFYELSPEYQQDGNLSKTKLIEYIGKAFEEGYCSFEWTHRKLNGEPIPCEITLVRVNYRNDYMVAGYVRDLRAIRKMMEKMREADECTQLLFDATPLSSCLFDKKLKVVECNHETLRLFGLPGKQELSANFHKLSPEYQADGSMSSFQFNKYADEAFEEGYARFEWIFQKLDSEPIPAEVTLVRVKFRGEYAIAGYIRDLRELKAMIAEMHRAEIAEESNKAKSDFLAKMSHEIRTPMNAILGITEIQLQDEQIPLATKEALERIYNSGDLLLGIINDILDLSKIEAGKLELSCAQYNIASLIHDTVKLNIMRYESKPIEFLLDVNEKIPVALIGDELRIKQILNNILSNAFKYTHEGMINLDVFCEQAGGAGSVTLVLRVTDTGQGMTEDQVRKLGIKYSRFNQEANRKTEGTGLGMNITQNLVKMMSGEINAESTPGTGSVFTVRLPQKYEGDAVLGKELADNLKTLNLKNTSKMRNAQITQDFMPYGRVLIVDDVETNLYVARGLLAPYGLSIDTALSGFEAIDIIKSGKTYDVIFMDHMMPRMDGIETVNIMRSLGYSKPIVALTANALTGQAEMFLTNGFNDFISKPIDIRQLNSSLNKLIRDRQSEQVLESARKQKSKLYTAGKYKQSTDSQLTEFFIRDAEKSAGILEMILRSQCSREDDMSMLIINTHAMKSALANVSEADLSQSAYELEQAGREKNTAFILEKLPVFISSLRDLIDRIRPADDKNDEIEAVEEADDIQYLREKLLVMEEACAAYDKNAAKKALAELKKKPWPHSIKENLSLITEHLLHSEFEEAAAIAKECMP
ncbi:MAG: response regulator [Treponema sp.]|jgi:signal transduction histidine kinase/CheY-like chemotaxis protein/HPt (histidine-containing phosphotransfer) domain-containing protein|nr:response regulator [Treponema sp.]